MELAGMWLTVLGYALLYTGVTSFQGGDVSFLSSLGMAPAPVATAAGPLGWLGGLWGLATGAVSGPAGFIASLFGQTLSSTQSSTSGTPTVNTTATPAAPSGVAQLT